MARKNRITISDDHTGDVGEVISGTSGPVALNGDVYQGETHTDREDSGGRTFSGNNITVVKGDHHGVISRNF
ncbi:hypothetical protein [Streptomyces sp. GSL17-111]|uniref:hypothetical protein n=1 Tax=Streptomyces sp. GSL17-111 TaxID=3121596 RepID=UPI0030F43D95